MADVPHFPILRAGKEYESLDRNELVSHRTGEPMASISQANAGLVKRDMKKIASAKAALDEIPVRELIERCVKAAEIFMHDELPLNEAGDTHSAEQYIASLSATSGMPHNMCRANMEKIAGVMGGMPTILAGLTRGMDLAFLDCGVGTHGDVPVWYTAETDALGVILPSNSPGVHSLWVPSIALKVPVVLKPGREEPWTPMRIAQALFKAGIPREAVSLYPTDHEGAATILERCGRSLLFGDENTTRPYAGNPAIEIHGPGRSKVILGEDEAENWKEHVDVLYESVARNGGRSCINASAIVTPSHGDEIAQALAERMGGIAPRDVADPESALCAFANPRFAEGINAAIERGLGEGGARDVTADFRRGDRHTHHDGAAYLLPTVVRCDSIEHSLGNTEYLFPFASVVELPQEQMLEKIGPSLVVTAITRDAGFIDELLHTPLIHRLNLGPVPTIQVEWDQPHEGNLFEFLFHRRAFQRARAW